MVPTSSLCFSNQDLRWQSFRQHPLAGAAFENCDLRGCDFRQADLRGARFVNCRTGYARQRVAIAALSLLCLLLSLGQAISTAIFVTQGMVPGQRLWPAMLLLSGLLTLSFGVAISSRVGGILPAGAHPLLGGVAGGLVGGVIGGSLTNDQPVVTLLAALILGGWGFGLGRQTTRLSAALLAMVTALMTYGFAVIVWTAASALVTTGHWLLGGGLAVVALVAIGETVSQVKTSLVAGRGYSTTAFCQANLAGCRFEATPLTNCDLSHANGVPRLP